MEKLPFIGSIIEFVNKQLNGFKTVIGIIAGVATFILLVCNQLSDGFQVADVEVIAGGFSALMVAIGLTHKAQKIENALKKS